MDLKNINKWRISRDYIKQLVLHVKSWHNLEDRRFDFALTFTDVVYKLELKLEFAMEDKTFSSCNCYYIQSNYLLNWLFLCRSKGISKQNG